MMRFRHLFLHHSYSTEALEKGKNRLVFTNKGPSLKEFLLGLKNPVPDENAEPLLPTSLPYLSPPNGNNQTFYVEVYGCQMNVNDTSIVSTILQNAGYRRSLTSEDADIVFLMTCAIRENAEAKIWGRLNQLKALQKKSFKKHTPSLSPSSLSPLSSRKPKIGVLGCMAERLKTKLLDADKSVDIVCGPDAYRSLPYLIDFSRKATDGVADVMLSADETYADIMPVRMDPSSKSAFVSIMRGCNNMCSFCVVPQTRGIERSRPVESILEEVKKLADEGILEVTLLGQNVNSYCDKDSQISLSTRGTELTPGFRTIYRRKEGGLRFLDLLDKASQMNPEVRFRFTSPHPKDFPEDLLYLIKERPNICNQLHLPAQSGSTTVLNRMRRGYTREAYLSLIENARRIIPSVSISTDMISGFCGETEEEHQDTLSLMEMVKYDQAFMFSYSLREKTHAHRNYKDDVPPEVKNRRLNEVIQVFQKNARLKMERLLGVPQVVLVEGKSKRGNDLTGRADGNQRIHLDNIPVYSSAEAFHRSMSNPKFSESESSKVNIQIGDYILVMPTSATSITMNAAPISKVKLSM